MKQIIGKAVVCKTAEKTISFARNFAKLLPRDSSVALIGDLGCGKTTFVKGMAEGFNIKETVSSPSFNILNIYYGDVTLLHIDAYRLNCKQQEANSLMLEDFLISPYCLIVEWPELLYGFLQTCDFKVCFSILEDFSREILADKYSK